MRWFGAVAPVLTCLVLTQPAAALGPRDVFVVYNKNLPASRAVADHYLQKRGVPAENLVALDLPTGEDISRDDYNRRVVAPLREALKSRKALAKVLLTVYGVPLRVGPQTPSEQDKAELNKLKPQLDQAQADKDKLVNTVRVLEEEVKKDPDGPFAAALPGKKGEQQEAERKLHLLEERQRVLSQAQSEASLDSELMLLWYDGYPLSRWIENPHYWRYPEDRRSRLPEPVLMTARLDGPNPEIAKRLVDDALAAEQKGLAGKVCIDARGIRYNPEADPAGTGYGGYDESFREAAVLMERDAKMDVLLDDQEPLLPPGSCQGCALYCGWYALVNYTPCCKFVPGAVAWHLASGEAVSLRDPGRQWCGNLLRDGAAATLGPVAEPYTVGFPRPEEFFGFLVTGRYTLVECYARTTGLTSWMMVLVGDPLYNPFAKAPKLKPEQVWPSPLRALRHFPM
jgi:uncharacterized protein (TIGR03790 family)